MKTTHSEKILLSNGLSKPGLMLLRAVQIILMSAALFSLFKFLKTSDFIFTVIGVGLITLAVLLNVFSQVRNVKLFNSSIIISEKSTHPTVAPLNSIKDVKSNKIGNITFVRVNYKLDGIRKNFLMMKSAESSKECPKCILTDAIEKNKKANL